MALAVMKSKAEQGIEAEFATAVDRLPGSKAVASERRRAFATFAELGFPHRRVEEWKYTDLRASMREALPIAVVAERSISADQLDKALGAFANLDATRIVMVDGFHRPELSSVHRAGEVEVTSLATVLTTAPDSVAAELIRPIGPAGESVAALNSSLATDGAIIRIGANVRLQRPVMVVHLETGNTPRQFAIRNSLVAKSGAAGTVIEVFASVHPSASNAMNVATAVSIGDGATITHVKTVLGAGSHVATLVARMGKDAMYRPFQYTERAGLVRNQSFVTFEASGTKLDLSGAVLGCDREHVDTTLTIDHTAPGCESRELFKAVLDGSSKAVFQGKVVVRQAAQKTDGKQMAQAMMLSEDAEFDSKPELEIYADDVACGHGSTCAQIDPYSLFYLRARGIPAAEARALLIRSFIGEAIEKVEDEAVREVLIETAGRWLLSRT